MRHLVGVLCATVLLVSCGDVVANPAIDGPFSSPNPRCVQGDLQAGVTAHVGSFEPNRKVELVKAELMGAKEVSMETAVFLPFAGKPTVTGTVLAYPPPESWGLVDSLATWDDRRKVKDAQLDGGDGLQALMVGLRIDATSKTGYLEGVRLHYRDDKGRDRDAEFPIPLVIKAPGEPCTAEEYERLRD